MGSSLTETDLFCILSDNAHWLLRNVLFGAADMLYESTEEKVSQHLCEYCYMICKRLVLYGVQL